MTTETTTPQLTQAQIAEIEARAAYPWVRFECDSDPGEAKHLPRGIVLTATERNALIRDWRALRAQVEKLLDDASCEICEAALYDEQGKQVQVPICNSCWNRLSAENAALREQLREEQARNQIQAETIMECEADITSLRERLELETQRRIDAEKAAGKVVSRTEIKP